MALYSYRAVTADGTVAEGRIEAGGRQEACRLLEGRGLQPVKLAEEADKSGAAKAGGGLRLKWGGKKVSFRALEAFTRQLASLLAAGVPLSRALRILAREAASPAAQKKWREVHDLVVDGTALADAMSKSPETFPHVYTAMVQAGEMGGFLDVVLGQIADFQRREKEMRSKVLAALIYPIVLAGLSAAVLIFLMVFFIPRFQSMFEGFGATLPLLTQWIVGMSHAVTKYGIFLLAGSIVVVVTLRNWLRSEQGRRAWERMLLRMPVFGPLVGRFALTRFCRMLGTLVGSGVPLINSLRVARESIGNQTLADAVTESIERVKRGDRLAQSLADCPQLFPGSVLEIISVAEETGRLDKELVRVAAEEDDELDRRMRMAVALSEPALLFMMASVIGTIIVGMVLPILTIQDYIK